MIFTVRAEQLQVLLVERGNEPFRGQLALPGGYLRGAETLEEAAVRELWEETQLDGARLHLEQLRTYSDPRRDPRGRVVTTAYLALGADLPTPSAGTDAKEASWMPVRDVLEEGFLAFDHGVILRDGLERARAKLEYTSIATVFCSEPFTIGELRRVYEVIWGIPLDPSNFRRKLTRAEGFLEPTGKFRTSTVGRPAALYSRGSAPLLMPPFLRAQENSLPSAGT
ncbi:NUDIX hydrolase [Actinophytocola xanthii]|uniref:NUDIX hydrolase n=1 Tax=Actinophytocola xanthii TaxID=1912961 RepID=UPI002FCE3B59